MTENNPLSLRRMLCDQNNLSRSDGSAIFFQGETAVEASVYGPRDVSIQKELIDKALVEVTYKPKVGLPGCLEKLRERIIRNSCESVLLTTLYPRTAISIILQEIQNSGSLLACCLNAACMALMDSGIEMKSLIAGVTCVIDSDQQLIIDPTLKQEKEAVAVLTFAFDSNERSMVASNTKGIVTETQLQECLVACREASEAIFSFYRESLEKRYSKKQKNMKKIF